ncbi:hypothetical protein ACO1O0_006785 [Amphichorda felina]
MVSPSYLLTLLAATVAVASPTPLPNEDYSLETRGGQVYVCRAGDDNKGQLYGQVRQDRAIGYFREAKTKTGKSGYPKPFSNNGKVMKFPSGCKKDVWELPVLASGLPYDYNSKKGGVNNPGEMRVYYTKDLKYCGIGGKKNVGGTGNPHNCELLK